jgi:hypothetical protein
LGRSSMKTLHSESTDFHRVSVRIRLTMLKNRINVTPD